MELLTKFEITRASYYSLLKVILKDERVTEENSELKIKGYINSKNMNRIEKKLFELLLYINPKKENFKSDLNRKFIINIMKYLLNIKEVININKNEDSKESDISENKDVNKVTSELIEKCAKIFDEDKLIKILFNDIPNIENKAEYLEMILMFIPEKEIQQIIKVIKNNLGKDNNKKEIIDIFQIISKKTNLKTEKGFEYLKDVLIHFLNCKNKFISSLNEVENRYIMKNKMLRCKQCFTLPTFSMNNENIINISYKCNKIHSVENTSEDDIIKYEFKCISCKELILECNKNYLCSNCKNIICPLCSQEHFEKCITIFFIPINEIDTICCEHKENFELYCCLCDINLCKRCSKEHYHYVEKEKDINIEKEQINKFNDIVKNNDKTNTNIKSAINNILQENKYQNNPQFIYFIRKVLGYETKTNCKLFNEFFDEEFKKYYANMINQIKLGNYYFLNKLINFLDYYENKKINGQYLIFSSTHNAKNSKQHIDILKKITLKLAILTKYFQANNDLKVQRQIIDNEIEIKNGLINLEENKILIKSILNSETLYRQELLKLIDRSLSENIIVYLIEKFHNNFKKIDLDLYTFTDIKRYYKNNPTKFEEIIINNEDIIKTCLNDALNCDEENDEKENKIIFEKPISIGNINISVIELNQILQFLFYIKEKGNFTAHPKSEKKAIINPNSHTLKLSKNNDDINKVEERMKKLLKSEYMKKYFAYEIKPKAIFDCLFESKFKPLINCENDVEINNKIDVIFNELFSGLNEYPKIEKKFEVYTKIINELKGIYEELNENFNFKEESEIKPSLPNEFFERMDKILNDEQKCISFLYKLNNNEYESSLTGECYMFSFYCLNYVTKKILIKINEKINHYQKVKEELEHVLQSKEQILSLLHELNKKVENLEEIHEKIIESN